MSRQVFVFLLAILASGNLAASEGDRAGNGGDPCEDRFTEIRDDIKSWINGGGSRGLRLPEGVSQEQYDAAMLSKIGAARVGCTREKIEVRGEEKVCRNQITGTGAARITCNREAFLALGIEDQYMLTHHEYAGLAGFEENAGAVSIYPLSRQISGFLESQIIRRLAIKPQAELSEVKFPYRITCTNRRFVAAAPGSTEFTVSFYLTTGLFRYGSIGGSIVGTRFLNEKLQITAEYSLDRSYQDMPPIPQRGTLTMDTSTLEKGYASGEFRFDSIPRSYPVDCSFYIY